MHTFHKYLVIPVISIFLFIGMYEPVHASAAISQHISFVILSDYSETMDIGEKLTLSALTANLSSPTWKSSDSKIASVSKNGVVTAKKAGSVTITAVSGKSTAECRITVRETVISLSQRDASIENGAFLRLSARTSNGSPVKWKTNKKSVATVSAKGLVTGHKPGTAIITATADGYSATCTVTVVPPTLHLEISEGTLYRNETLQLKCKTSSGLPVVWRSNRSSVATVDSHGLVIAKKHGTAVISAKLDGVTAECTITVASPEIILSHSKTSLSIGEQLKLNAVVSSGNDPVWSSSNISVCSVDEHGVITAISSGKAYIYASEDGTKVRCQVTVTDS